MLEGDGRLGVPAWLAWREAGLHQAGQAGKSKVDNGHIESFNDRLRDELLNTELFLDIDDARRKIEAWRVDYNGNRPHTALSDMTPDEFAAKHSPSREAIFNLGWAGSGDVKLDVPPKRLDGNGIQNFA